MESYENESPKSSFTPWAGLICRLIIWRDNIYFTLPFRYMAKGWIKLVPVPWKDKENKWYCLTEPIQWQANERTNKTKNSRWDSSLVVCKMTIVSAIKANIYHEKKSMHILIIPGSSAYGHGFTSYIAWETIALYHLLSAWPWANYLTSRCFSFLSNKRK